MNYMFRFVDRGRFSRILEVMKVQRVWLRSMAASGMEDVYSKSIADSDDELYVMGQQCLLEQDIEIDKIRMVMTSEEERKEKEYQAGPFTIFGWCPGCHEAGYVILGHSQCVVPQKGYEDELFQLDDRGWTYRIPVKGWDKL